VADVRAVPASADASGSVGADRGIDLVRGTLRLPPDPLPELGELLGPQDDPDGGRAGEGGGEWPI